MSIAAILPEAQRNARIQLRPRRMLAALVVSVVASITLYIYYTGPHRPDDPPIELLRLVWVSAVLVLIVGGGIYCVQSIHREKELNTFDYQRITRLTPLELTLGKLFGAPSLTYFIALCLLPITLMAAFGAAQSVGVILWLCIISLLGTIAYHAFALWLSLFTGRASSAGALLVFLVAISLTAVTGADRRGMLAFQGLSPFSIYQILSNGRSAGRVPISELPLGRDLVFTVPIPHVLVLSVLYLTLIAWFLVALVRNIKRDPSLYEVYSPAQAFGFVVYLHLIVLAFFQWQRFTPYGGLANQIVPIAPMEAENELLSVSLFFFALFALALLRNREYIRRKVLTVGVQAASWWAALWPAPYVLAGVFIVGAAFIAVLQYELHPVAEWSLGIAVVQVCFLAAWIIRDSLYLQWMAVRKGRRSLLAGFIYLIVFYGCSSALFSTWGPTRVGPLAAFFQPWATFDLAFVTWNGAQQIWIGAAILMAIEALVFAALHRQQLLKLAESAGT